jgi:hypothetical protein
MGDADDSYDWREISGIVQKVLKGDELVMGNRFLGGIKPGAMPFLHRYLGNPVLSFLGRLFFKVPVGDFHCGLRGFSRSAILKLSLQTTGMEFASEMVVKAALNKLRIAEVPVVLHPDGRDRAPHLRTWRDGWRHLKFLLLFSPRWLFLLPGIALFLLGSAGMIALIPQPFFIGPVGLDIHSLAYLSASVVLGFQMILFAVFSKIIGQQRGLLPRSPMLDAFLKIFSLELGLLLAAFCFLVGIALTWGAFETWSAVGYGALDPKVTMRWVVPSITMLALGGEIGLGAFFLETITMQRLRSGVSARPAGGSSEIREL